MQGFVLENADVIVAMEHDGDGVYIPARIDKDGNIKGKTLDLRELSKLWDTVDENLVNMGEELHRGSISALPAQAKTTRKSARNANIGTSARMKIICLQENWTITENSERGMKNGSQVDD